MFFKLVSAKGPQMWSLMRICTWAFHLDDNAFKMGSKDIPDDLADHVLIGSCQGILVPVSACVCLQLFCS